MTPQNFSTPPTSDFGLFTVVEALLPARLGIPRKLIATIRQEVLEKDADWRLLEKEVRLTESAVRRIVAAYDSLKNAPAALAPIYLEKNAAPLPDTLLPLKVAEIERAARESSSPQKTGWVALTVLAVVRTNPKIIYAAALNGAGRVVVRVQDSRFWRPQMVVRARLVAGNIYERVGRDPRWAGDTP